MRSIIVKKRTLALLAFGLAGLTLLFLGWRGDLVEKKEALPGLKVSGPVSREATFESSSSGPLGRADQENTKTAGVKDVSDFFVEYRLERERTRGQRVEWLREVINNTGSSAESRQKAQDHLMSISRNMEKEVELENLIRASGYRDAAVFVDERAVSVVVAAEKLSAEESGRISELVSKRTGMEPKNISVIAKT